MSWYCCRHLWGNKAIFCTYYISNFFLVNNGCLSHTKLCLILMWPLYFLGRLSHRVYLRSQVFCSKFSHYENYRVHLGLVCPIWMAAIPSLKHPVMKVPSKAYTHSHTHITQQDSILNANKCLRLILFAFLVNHLYYSTSIISFSRKNVPCSPHN